MKEEILDDFKSKKKVFNAFKDRMINLIRDLIEKEGINPHQVTGRTKDTLSLSKKIDKKGEKYNSLGDITDVVGLRVITYLESEVDPIAKIIENEFEKDEENSIDKRILKNDQFGYRSLHVVVSLNNKRIKLPEYSNYKTIKCEIQIRSILQHAWAEIEHDLGYKGTNVPDAYKRSFNRVAALLEVADIEFVKLKSELTNYERTVPELIVNSPEEVDINKASLSSFIETNLIINEARKIIVKESGHQMTHYNNLDRAMEILNYLNFKTIKSLEESLEENKTGFLKFVKHFIKERGLKKPINMNAILMYFGHYLSILPEDISLIKKYLTALDFSDASDVVAERFIRIFNESKS